MEAQPRIRVLVIEDDKLSRVLIEETLSDLDSIDLMTATTVRDGLRLLAGESRFDLVLLDWRLEGRPAQGILEMAASMNASIRPEVVLVTGSILPEEISSLVPSTISRILVKPIEIHQLVEVVTHAGGYRFGEPTSLTRRSLSA